MSSNAYHCVNRQQHAYASTGKTPKRFRQKCLPKFVSSRYHVSGPWYHSGHSDISLTGTRGAWTRGSAPPGPAVALAGCQRPTVTMTLGL
jgi:hypothetical protein